MKKYLVYAHYKDYDYFDTNEYDEDMLDAIRKDPDVEIIRCTEIAEGKEKANIKEE